jgi:hypothetical protein
MPERKSDESKKNPEENTRMTAEDLWTLYDQVYYMIFKDIVGDSEPSDKKSCELFKMHAPLIYVFFEGQFRQKSGSEKPTPQDAMAVLRRQMDNPEDLDIFLPQFKRYASEDVTDLVPFLKKIPSGENRAEWLFNRVKTGAAKRRRNPQGDEGDQKREIVRDSQPGILDVMKAQQHDDESLLSHSEAWKDDFAPIWEYLAIKRYLFLVQDSVWVSVVGLKKFVLHNMNIEPHSRQNQIHKAIRDIVVNLDVKDRAKKAKELGIEREGERQIGLYYPATIALDILRDLNEASKLDWKVLGEKSPHKIVRQLNYSQFLNKLEENDRLKDQAWIASWISDVMTNNMWVPLEKLFEVIHSSASKQQVQVYLSNKMIQWKENSDGLIRSEKKYGVTKSLISLNLVLECFIEIADQSDTLIQKELYLNKKS